MEFSLAESAAVTAACDEWETSVDSAGWTLIQLHGYRMPQGLAPGVVDLLLHLPPGFPDAQPDMFWVRPDVTVTQTGAAPPQADQRQVFLGLDWQRFSRHLQPGAWVPGLDDLQTWLAAVRGQLTLDGAR
jgi:hypothetical protein